MNKIRLPPLPTIRDLVKLYRLRAIKQLSQNFLMDPRLIDKIVNCAGNIMNHYICEVGPGPGGITRSILKRNPKKLIVVEKDPRFIPTLELLQESSPIDMQIEIGDILKFNLANAFSECSKIDWDDKSPPIHLIGNLPFSVSTYLIIQWLDFISKKGSVWNFGRVPMTLTFQKEVGERIVAPMRHEQRCRLSVICQTYCYVNHKFVIPGQAFIPKPDVDVSVVNFTPRKFPKTENLPFKLVEKVIRQIFHMRQKYCIRGMETLFPEYLRKEMANKMCVLADVNPKTRPFQLSNDEFVRLCFAYNEICNDNVGLYDYDYRAPKAGLVEQNVSESLIVA